MLPFIQVSLLCGMCYVGLQALMKHRATPKALWLMSANRCTTRGCWSSRVYIIRCWKERTQPDAQPALRYSLENPTTGQRCGYISADRLLETLAMELTGTQETDAGQLTFVA